MKKSPSKTVITLKDRKRAWSDRHYRDHKNLSRKGGEKPKRGKRKTTPGPIAPWLPKRLSEITASNVRSWLKKEAQHRPTQTRLAWGAIRAFVGWCNDREEYQGIVDPEAVASRVARQVLPKKSAKNDVLQREQLPFWFAAVDGIHNPVISVYLQALLLTGARREEMATLRWEEVDFKWRSLTIKDKVEGERTIPLTPYLGVMLASLPRRNEWVFSSPSAKAGYINDPRNAHKKALEAAGLPHVSLHGLRRSFGSLSEWCELPAGVVAQVMGHRPSATAEKHYRCRPLDLLRKWHTTLEAWILEQADVQFVENNDTAENVVDKTMTASWEPNCTNSNSFNSTH